jgi:trans-2,3-dihydro-3-hydroxyanthranilate isomerase
VIVDVFTDRIFGGNQLAVILDAASLSSTEMQAIAREFNFSESTFVLPPESPGAVKRVRIFTPSFEMPFAGHPTIGTAFVLDHEGYLQTGTAQTEAILDENIGPVVIRIERGSDTPGLIWMQHRLPQWGPTFTDNAAVARMLGLEPDDLRADLPMQVVSTGVPYLMVGIRDLDAMARISFDVGALADVFASNDPAAVFVWTKQAQTEQGDVHCRMFWHHGREVFEDPATGSANGPLGAFLVQYGVVPRAPHVRILSEQGWEMGRPSLITIDVMTDEHAITDLWIAGQTVLVARGTLTLPD